MNSMGSWLRTPRCLVISDIRKMTEINKSWMLFQQLYCTNQSPAISRSNPQALLEQTTRLLNQSSPVVR